MKSALVLSGGGARGAYEIGVWKALKELKYVPDIITGTSVGALNGALITMGEDDLALKIWENMSMDMVFEKKQEKDINTINSAADFIVNLGQIGGIDPKPLKKLLEKVADERKIRESNIDFGMVVTGLKPKRKIEIYAKDIQDGKIIDYILASSACFPIMKKYKIGEDEYMDGGYCDNTPINMAIDRGARELVVVDMPGIFKLKKIEDVNAKVYYIRPKFDLGNLMIFNKENSKNNIELGYFDTMKVFNRLEGNYYTFEKGTVARSLAYNKTCKYLYRKIFTQIPSVGVLEKMATEKINKYLRDYSSELFELSSNVLDLLEITAKTYKIDYLKVYSFKGLTNLIMKEYEKTRKSQKYKDTIKVLELKEGLSLEELTKVIKGYDLKSIIAYMVDLLQKRELTVNEKNQILTITLAMPNYLCAAIYICMAS
ncbi:MAG: patatin-like phospholipase family protein [Clostridia bacterium]|nr:patatin-like phospholipase family protein [Clostridia bacterium]